MKQKFSKSWKSSKQPRKQRKYRANAPLHIKKKFVSVNLSKELRKKYGKRNISVKKDDVVKIMRGKFKGKQGKITEVKLKISKVAIEGIQVKKQDGSKVNIKLQPSNLQIIELNLEDRKRKSKISTHSSKDEQLNERIKKLGIKTENKKEEKVEDKEAKEKEEIKKVKSNKTKEKLK